MEEIEKEPFDAEWLDEFWHLEDDLDSVAREEFFITEIGGHDEHHRD